MQRRHLCTALLGVQFVAAARPQPASLTLLRPKPGAAQPPRLVKWEQLLAPGWDTSSVLKGADGKPLDLASMSDADPRTAQLYQRMRQALDQAPVNLALIDQTVRIAGYVVPIETDAQQGVREFLLVPSHGACIHTPAPPASQVIHVLARPAAKGLRTMDTVWVQGVLKFARHDTGLAWSNWRIDAPRLEPYEGGGTAAVR